MSKISIPQTVRKIIKKITSNGFEAFVVGGCVRDMLLDREPNDWDVTTNAKPEEVLKVFPDGKYENDFGTVMIPEKYLGEKESKKIIEVTTYRIESKYSDRRHPDKVKFAKTLEEDLSRRDFTINALALKLFQARNQEQKKREHEIVDFFCGQKDLKKAIIRAVGDPNERFEEDALRMMRAVRFAAELDFEIEKGTVAAIKKNQKNLGHISEERKRDELEKIILSDNPKQGVDLLVEMGLMKNIIPEIYDTIGVRQNRHHYHGPFNTVYKHMLASLEKCPSKKLEVRLAAFFHDIGKPQSKKGKGELATFHGHEYISARMVETIMKRLKFPRKVIEQTVLLVKNHMFYYNVDEVGEKGVRKVVRKVGLDNIEDLIDVRIGDRLGSGVPKAVPYKLRHFKYMVDKVSADPVSVNQLKLDGNDLMKQLKIKPGPKIGAILEVLLARVIDEPKLNTKRGLLKIASELKKENLDDLRKLAKEKISNKKTEEDQKRKGKFWVK